METQTRYDLNAAIENWRAELAAQPNLTAEVRRELETHLRDAIAGFQQRGLNDEESFWLARRRVGQPQQLCEEFVKADPAKVWRERVFWMVLCLFLMHALNSFSMFVSSLYMIPDWLLMPLNFLLNFIPIGLVVLVGFGKMTQPLTAFTHSINGRFRLAYGILIMLILLAILQSWTENLWFDKLEVITEKTGGHMQHSFWKFANESGLTLLVMAIVLIWLMPTQNRKTPKYA